MISIWPWSRISELTMEVLRQRGIACKVREERDWFQMVAKTWEGNSDADNRWRERAEFFEANATEHNRSRRGWKWLYEQKCEQWQYLAGQIRWVDDLYDNTFQRLTEEQVRRDGWERKGHDQETEIVALMGQVRQSDGNTQRVEAERDALHQQLEEVRGQRNMLERDSKVQKQRRETMNATIERLEAALRDAQHNDQRDSRGRFTSG